MRHDFPKNTFTCDTCSKSFETHGSVKRCKECAYKNWNTTREKMRTHRLAVAECESVHAHG